MPAPTVNVTATISGQDGQPVQGATVQMVLDRSEVYRGFVVKEGAFGTTDASGTVILPVFPNALGVNGSQYRVVISTPEQTIRSTAVVPNSACNLHDIMQTPPYPPISLAQQATNQAQTYAAQASANAASASGHKDAAAASASTAGVSKTAAETARDAAVAAQAGATSARVSSETARDAAVAARDAAQAAAASMPSTGTGPGEVPTNADLGSLAYLDSLDAADVGAIPTTDKGAANGVASLGSDGKVPSGQLPTIWQTTAAFTRTGAGSGTVTDNAANQALFRPGRPLRALSGSTYTYHIVTAYSAGTVTVAGPALPTTIDALAYGDVSRVVQETFNFSGYFADGADAALIERDLLTRYLWRLGKAYCVWFAVRPLVDDSGVAQPRVNVTCAGFAVSTSNINAGLAVNDTQWVSTTTDISSANYDIAWGEILEVAVDANGTNANARDLTLVAVFVLE